MKNIVVEIGCMLLAAIFCTCASVNEYTFFRERTVFRSVPVDTNKTISYLKKTYLLPDYVKIKNTELEKTQSILREKYNLTFKTRYTKYINYAYRCSENRILQLNAHILQFFTQYYLLYFLYEPEKVITVVLFDSKWEYDKYAKKDLHGNFSNITYGHFIPTENMVVSYGSTGFGTISHELMHAFLYANVKTGHSPEQWFDEGLASFYEHPVFANNIFDDGYVNWRMPGLQKMIAAKEFEHIRKLFMGHFSFQKEGYGQARFLFCYLWSKNKLVPFVRQYMYILLPQYTGIELRRKTISLLENILEKDIDAINKEYIDLALKVRENQKMPKLVK